MSQLTRATSAPDLPESLLTPADSPDSPSADGGPAEAAATAQDVLGAIVLSWFAALLWTIAAIFPVVLVAYAVFLRGFGAFGTIARVLVAVATLYAAPALLLACIHPAVRRWLCERAGAVMATRAFLAAGLLT